MNFILNCLYRKNIYKFITMMTIDPRHIKMTLPTNINPVIRSFNFDIKIFNKNYNITIFMRVTNSFSTDFNKEIQNIHKAYIMFFNVVEKYYDLNLSDKLIPFPVFLFYLITEPSKVLIDYNNDLHQNLICKISNLFTYACSQAIYLNLIIQGSDLLQHLRDIFKSTSISSISYPLSNTTQKLDVISYLSYSYIKPLYKTINLISEKITDAVDEGIDQKKEDLEILTHDQKNIIERFKFLEKKINFKSGSKMYDLNLEQRINEKDTTFDIYLCLYLAVNAKQTNYILYKKLSSYKFPNQHHRENLLLQFTTHMIRLTNNIRIFEHIKKTRPDKFNENDWDRIYEKLYKRYIGFDEWCRIPNFYDLDQVLSHQSVTRLLKLLHNFDLYIHRQIFYILLWLT